MHEDSCRGPQQPAVGHRHALTLGHRRSLPKARMKPTRKEETSMQQYPNRRRFLLAASAIGFGGGGAIRFGYSPAVAQSSWKPNRPIQVVIQFAAGGGTDAVIRT